MDTSEPTQRIAAKLDLDAALRRAVRGGPKITDAHLRIVERDVVVGGTRTTVHCYCVPLDAHGRARVEALIEFLANRIVDYAIPRKSIEEAKQQFNETGSTAAIVKLEARARSLFTHLANSGEGGELLLFTIAESVFNLAQILCKMSLKTSSEVHYHGADGVYAAVRRGGGLDIYWAESKVFNDPASAIRDCLSSLKPFLVEPDHAGAKREGDNLLINEFANFDDPEIVKGLKAFLDRDKAESLTVRHNGFAMVAFDSAAYTTGDTALKMDDIENALRTELPRWQTNIGNRLTAETLKDFDIHFICIPIPSASDFRAYLLELLGVTSES